jgi:hypothetical protein
MLKKIFILKFFVLLTLTKNIYSFPGDHNSLTCDKNFIGLKANVYDKALDTFVEKEIKPDVYNKEKDKFEGIFTDIYRKDPKDLDENGKISRKNIVQAIQLDLLKPFAQSIVRQNIRSRIETYDTETGKDIHITRQGDSLSEFVNFYIMTPSHYRYTFIITKTKGEKNETI